MSALMKKLPTNNQPNGIKPQSRVVKSEAKVRSKGKLSATAGVYCATESGAVLCIPKAEVKRYQINDVDTITSIQQKIERQLESTLSKSKDVFAVFSDLNETHGKQGALLKGLRIRENLNQAQFATIIHITQPELSKMESGKRTVGKEIAKRLQDAFGVNYRLFL
jgi:DNA-binding transcriptional regulator YiaG